MKFLRIKKGSKMSFNDFQQVITALAAKKQSEPDVLYDKLLNKEPVTAGTVSFFLSNILPKNFILKLSLFLDRIINLNRLFINVIL